MTDRLKRERSLPEGYQFGDARGLSAMTLPLTGPGAAYSRLAHGRPMPPLPNMHKIYREYRDWMAKQPPISEWPGYNWDQPKKAD